MNDPTIEHGLLLSVLNYQPESGAFFWMKSGARAGSKNNHGYVRIEFQRRRLAASRLAWFYMTGTWPDGEIEHINGVRDDNKWSNLREKRSIDAPALSADEVRRLFSYDPTTGKIYRRVAMSKHPAGSECGNYQDDYIYVAYKRRLMLAHRLAWALHYGEWPEGLLDHINTNRMDNRISNLRLATIAANNRNRAPDSRSTTGIKGVMFDKKAGKYVAKITMEKRTFDLGRFDDPNAAAIAYNNAARQLHGEFAWLNPIGENDARQQ